MPRRNFSAGPAASPSTFASSVRARPFLFFIDTSATSKPALLLSLRMCPSRFLATTSSCQRPWFELLRSKWNKKTSVAALRSVKGLDQSSCIFLFASSPFQIAPVGNHVAADEQPLFGYSAESSRTERQWEEKLRAIPSPENLRAYMQKLSARPHHVGSAYDKNNAEWIAAKFKEFGLDTHIEQFDVLFPTPKERVVELVEGG